MKKKSILNAILKDKKGMAPLVRKDELTEDL
jgi:hypothetical protein